MTVCLEPIIKSQYLFLSHFLWVTIALLTCNHVRMLRNKRYNIDVEKNIWVPQVCDYWLGSPSIRKSLCLTIQLIQQLTICFGCPGPSQAPQAFLSCDGGRRPSLPLASLWIPASPSSGRWRPGVGRREQGVSKRGYLNRNNDKKVENADSEDEYSPWEGLAGPELCQWSQG